ncbi:hypothetical protein [Halosolutus gelatinilyticus]|uniref:hypothetical protein n=1 Tax=Halosolutus gelatinilyticus TaxID=2931975 RepID=UPI001FF5E770|nr:hypothetical protein [Halosolutus gelatinilyticus]
MDSDDLTSAAPRTDRSTDERTTSGAERRLAGPAAIPDRYAVLSLADGEGLIYDQRNPGVWIQSDVIRSLDRMV